ncbi:MAG: hypothetical protein J5I35_07635 [Methanothrix harundinacea]|nr:hypothetical protein [Methanothrix harundinacea]
MSKTYFNASPEGAAVRLSIFKDDQLDCSTLLSIIEVEQLVIQLHNARREAKSNLETRSEERK